MRLFVGNLAEQATEAALREHFAGVGPLAYIHLPTHRDTGKPRGIAFIEFHEEAQAAEAIRRFHNQPFQGEPLIVSEARARGAGPGVGKSTSAHASVTSPGRSGTPRGPETGPPHRGEARRNFGPDAAPRDRRKSAPRRQKSAHAPRRPMRERFSGQFFGVDEDDTDGDTPNEGHLPPSQE